MIDLALIAIALFSFYRGWRSGLLKSAFSLLGFIGGGLLGLIAGTKYLDGVSNIFVKNLEKISLSDRPVHSNDVKRELFYIRNNNKWFKETDDYMNLIKAIKAIANKNFAHMIKWREHWQPRQLICTPRINQCCTCLYPLSF